MFLLFWKLEFVTQIFMLPCNGFIIVILKLIKLIKTHLKNFLLLISNTVNSNTYNHMNKNWGSQ